MKNNTFLVVVVVMVMAAAFVAKSIQTSMMEYQDNLVELNKALYKRQLEEK